MSGSGIASLQTWCHQWWSRHRGTAGLVLITSIERWAHDRLLWKVWSSSFSRLLRCVALWFVLIDRWLGRLLQWVILLLSMTCAGRRGTRNKGQFENVEYTINKLHLMFSSVKRTILFSAIVNPLYCPIDQCFRIIL